MFGATVASEIESNNTPFLPPSSEQLTLGMRTVQCPYSVKCTSFITQASEVKSHFIKITESILK